MFNAVSTETASFLVLDHQARLAMDFHCIRKPPSHHKPMRTLRACIPGLLVVAFLTGCAQLRFVPYHGQYAAWPTADTFPDQMYEVAVYRSWPSKAYNVLGHIEFDKPGVEWNQGDIKMAAAMAKKLNGDALIMAPSGDQIHQGLALMRKEVGIDGSRAAAVVVKWK